MNNSINKKIKYTVFASNFLLFILSCAILGTAIFLYFKAGTNEFLKSLVREEQFRILKFIAMGFAGLVILASCLGCYGSYQESQLWLSVHYALLTASFAVNVAGAFLIFMYQPQMMMRLDSHVNASFYAAVSTKTKIDASDSDLLTYMVMLQSRLGCCGYNSSHDYIVHKSQVPISCCNYKYYHCKLTDKTIEPKASFPRGCHRRFLDFTNSKFTILKLMLSSLVILQFVSILVSQMLCCYIRLNHNSNDYTLVRQKVYYST